ncbi:MAG: hypothetical protein HZA53_17170 [Planctomycetes bacterium]|nr:hypothetical protein [Planctomycetota bacterium]
MRLERARALVDEYRGRPMLVDSNLLVVLLIGLWRPDLLGGRATGDEYRREDFEFLARLLESARPWIVTPHILTEADNRIERVGINLAPNARAFVGRFLDRLEETRPRASRIVEEHGFARLGLADGAIIRVARKHACLVVTSDHALSTELGRLDLPVLYYPELRQRFSTD